MLAKHLPTRKLWDLGKSKKSCGNENEVGVYSKAFWLWGFSCSTRHPYGPVFQVVIPNLRVDLCTKLTWHSVMGRSSLDLIPYLSTIGVFMLRHIPCFFEKGEITVAFNIAHQSWIAIPVPSMISVWISLNGENVTYQVPPNPPATSTRTMSLLLNPASINRPA